MDIEFKDGAACYADGECHYPSREGFVEDSQGFETSFLNIMNYSDFQLNTIKQGDFIAASELDTKQKYNDAVEVFELLGFECHANYSLLKSYGNLYMHNGKDIHACTNDSEFAKRKITFNQLMAIGELRRLEVERDKAVNVPPNHFIPKDGGYALSEDVVNKPSHYQFFEGVEVIEIIASSMTREQFKGYCLGNRIKYRLRAGNKDKLEQDIAKSDKYVELYDEYKHLCK